MKKKTIVFIAVAGILVLTFSLFAVLLVKFHRGADPNNEDAVLAEAQAAAESDDPPAVAGIYRRLTKLNPFNEEYARAYVHALLRVRDFDALAAYTNSHPVTVELTESERRTEELIDRSAYMESLGSNAVSVATLEEATNINYYAATPLLISSYVRARRIDLALDAARPYIRRFPRPLLLVSVAEWCTLAKRTDLLAEVRAAVPKGTGHFLLVFAYYCDALEAWDKGDAAALVKAMNAVGTEIRTPFARLLKLEAVSSGDDADRVEQAYRALREAQPLFVFTSDMKNSDEASDVNLSKHVHVMLNLRIRGKMAVKRFIAAHFPNKEFPDRKFSIVALGQLADLVMEDGDVELDLLRVSLFAKIANNSLSEFDLQRAKRKFPDDKGIQLICEQYKRDADKAAAEAAKAKAADDAKIAAEAKVLAEKEAAAEARAAEAVKAAEAAKAAEKAKAAEVGKE